MSVLPVGIAASGDEGYTIEDSLRFRSSASAYLNRTPASASNQKTWTFSFWSKAGTLSAYRRVFSTVAGASQFYFRLDNNDQFTIESAGTVLLNSTPVYRDPSSWYHFLIVLDTTQATASNRLKVYVNGTQVTAFDTTNYPALNSDHQWNNNVAHYISGHGSGEYFDGYVTEANFIDGQALDPTDFGEFDNDTGVWKPKAYSGTYGTNGFYLDFSNGATKHSVTANGNVQHSTTQSKIGGSSVYFDGSGDYLSLSDHPDWDFSGDFTVEYWFRPSTASGVWDCIISNTSSYYSGSPDAGWGVYHRPDYGHLLAFDNGSSNTYMEYRPNKTDWATDGSTWYHVAWVRSSGTIKCYVDGSYVAPVSSVSNQDHSVTSSNSLRIGRLLNNNWDFTGYMDEIRISNTARYTGSFTPSTTPFAEDSNTLLLIHSDTTNGSTTFVDSSGVEGGPGNDQSGQANHWTPNNINSSASSLTTYDLMNDVPTLTDEDTANYATLNSVDIYPGKMFALDGNLKWNDTSGGSWCRSTISPTSGKWYWEVSDFSTTNWMIGVSDGSESITNYYAYYSGAPTALVYLITGQKYVAGSASSFISAIATTDVVGFAVDADAGSLAVYKNGTLQGTITGLSYGSYSPMVAPPAVGSCVFNFGQRPFAYTPPTGFLKLNTYNLPDSTIEDGSEHFNTVTFSANGSAASVTGVGFQPDFIWAKNRTNAYNHEFWDAIRGVNSELQSNTSAAEITDVNRLVSFDSDGFSYGTSSNIYVNGTNSVAWNWKANGSGSTNSAGTNGASIASTYSVNTTSGFSVVTYTGTGSNGTIYHGLGNVPDMMIFKTRSTSNNWFVYHSAAGIGSNPAAYRLLFNLTNNRAANGTFLNNTQPTATVATIGTDSGTNQSGITYVSYHFASIEGFSKFGSYMGNGNANGPFIYTGFRPAFVLMKAINNTGDWWMQDSARNTYNVVNNQLYANSNSTEQNDSWSDFLSNGFKIRNTYGANNGSGYTYLYAAFAENPFKNALAR